MCLPPGLFREWGRMRLRGPKHSAACHLIAAGTLGRPGLSFSEDLHMAARTALAGGATALEVGGAFPLRIEKLSGPLLVVSASLKPGPQPLPPMLTRG